MRVGVNDHFLKVDSDLVQEEWGCQQLTEAVSRRRVGVSGHFLEVDSGLVQGEWGCQLAAAVEQ